jgi:hypothetical protein
LLVIPVLAMTAASADMHTEDAHRALRGLERLDNVVVAPLGDAEQAAALADAAAKTGLEQPDAHVAAVANTLRARPVATDRARDLPANPLRSAGVSGPVMTAW